MKKIYYFDLLSILFLPILFSIFGFIPLFYNFYKDFNTNHPFIMSFLKFAILATYGEVAAFRINNKRYPDKSFGIFPKMIVWGILGVFIKAAFIIFGKGTISLLSTIFKDFPVNILSQKNFTLLKLFFFSSISFTMNLIFAPIMMLSHKLTDIYINRSGGTFAKILKTKFELTELLKSVDWDSFGNFVLLKTIPFFWIPAHTITFLIAESFQILFAAILSVVLGIFLAYKPFKK